MEIITLVAAIAIVIMFFMFLVARNVEAQRQQEVDLLKEGFRLRVIRRNFIEDGERGFTEELVWIKPGEKTEREQSQDQART